MATLRLTGPSYADVCDGATAAAKRRKRVRRLWGDGKGSFRTSGRYSAATVRGTRWLTEDRCDGTITRVVRGEVRGRRLRRGAAGPDAHADARAGRAVAAAGRAGPGRR